MTSHTPSPWTQDDNQIFGADGAMLICTVTSSDDFPCITEDDEQSEAEVRAACDLECAMNAKLILAAPDMLDALNAVHEPYKYMTEEALRDGVLMEFGPPKPAKGAAILKVRAAIAKATASPTGEAA